LKILVRFQKKFWPITGSIFLIQIAQIVEAGPHTRDEPNHVQPGRYLSCFLRPTETFTFHKAEPSPAVGDRSVAVPTGRALGGGSSVNCMKAIFVISTQTEVMI
jgi:GMC oxidoreductase